jgi:hypothetical protein
MKWRRAEISTSVVDVFVLFLVFILIVFVVFVVFIIVVIVDVILVFVGGQQMIVAGRRTGQLH